MPDRSTWIEAQAPNYETNVNKGYRYSEKEHNPHSFMLVPLQNPIYLVDFWGEGFVKVDHANKRPDISGFKDCYNINHQYQLVSNGKDRNKKIPNRIPTKGYGDNDALDLQGYILSSSIQYITLMNAPITDKVADEIARILNKDNGTFIHFYDAPDEDYESHLNKSLAEFYFVSRRFLASADPKIMEHLQPITFKIGSIRMAYDKIFHTVQTKYNDICVEDFVNIFQQLHKRKENASLNQIVKILDENNSETLLLIANNLCNAYQVSNDKHLEKFTLARDVVYQMCNTGNIILYIKKAINESFKFAQVYKFFQECFGGAIALLSGLPVSIRNVQYDMFLKLPHEMVDKDKDKPVFGGATDRGIEEDSKDRFYWIFNAITDSGNTNVFTIYNYQFKMPLKLPKKMVDKDDDKPAYCGNAARGIEQDTKNRFYWKLVSTMLYDSLVFYLINVEFNMPLKLPIQMVDTEGDKPAYGGAAKRKIEQGQEKRFQWYIDGLK